MSPLRHSLPRRVESGLPAAAYRPGSERTVEVEIRQARPKRVWYIRWSRYKGGLKGTTRVPRPRNALKTRFHPLKGFTVTQFLDCIEGFAPA